MRNMLVNLGLIFLFFPVLSLGSTPCWKKPVYITPLGADAAKKLFNTYPKEIQNQILKYNSEDEEQVLSDLYKADITNNGQPIYVFETLYMRTEYISAIQEINHKIQPSDMPNDSGSPLYSQTYYNEQAKRSEFLTRLCGKTYISFDAFNADKEKHNRDTFLWTAKNGKAVDACDSDWANFERSTFNDLYHAGKYDDALSQLRFYLDKCKGIMDTQAYLWMQNDLLLAATKETEKSDCKYIIEQIAGNSAYASASPAFKKAFEFNQKLCH